MRIYDVHGGLYAPFLFWEERDRNRGADNQRGLWCHQENELCTAAHSAYYATFFFFFLFLFSRISVCAWHIRELGTISLSLTSSSSSSMLSLLFFRFIYSRSFVQAALPSGVASLRLIFLCLLPLSLVYSSSTIQFVQCPSFHAPAASFPSSSSSS